MVVAMMVRHPLLRSRALLPILAALTLSVTASAASAAAQSREPPGPAATHNLTIDDVLDIEQLDRATLSPDGAWVAAVIGRPVGPGEVYGRTSYEVDPSRSDVWLISTATGERRALTHGAADAAGYWCATWSPDGRRLAMLSTQPEGAEPRGGDNVRLYVWDRESRAVTRMSDAAVMTQTRYGSPLYRLDLRGGADASTVAHGCNDVGVEENAPFLWLDDHRLLAAMLPPGKVSGLIDQYARPARTEARDAKRLRDGIEPTVELVGSGAATVPPDPADNRADLTIVDVSARTLAPVATVPTYPFRGLLTVAVSPDGTRLAVLATLGALAPAADRELRNVWDTTWTVERRLGFVDLRPDAAMRWVTMPEAGRYPLELFGWSPDSRRVALRARADRFAAATPLFVADARSGQAKALGTRSVGEPSVESPHERAALWADDRHLVARPTTEDTTAPPWQIIDLDGTARPLADHNQQLAFRRRGDGQLVAVSGDGLLRLDPTHAALDPVARLAGTAQVFWPQDPEKPSERLLIGLSDADGFRGLEAVSTGTGKASALYRPTDPTLIDADLGKGLLLFRSSSRDGMFLRTATLAGGGRELLHLDGFMAGIDWGETRAIDYRGRRGEALKGAVILPPGYRPGRRYPTLAWVYAGYRVRGLDGDYWLHPFMPGIYNLQLYAARGYVVLIPSMPLPPRGERREVYAHLADGVMPAIDRLVELGISDPDRLGVFGQSFGGYSVYGLLAQTDRFKAGVAIAGLTDLTALFGEFDPTARGYPGIAHEKSDNWAEFDLYSEQALPWQDPASYARNSPLSHVADVHTPLLMIHGTADIRGPATQAEQFFYALYAQGKTAQLARYGGESHSLAQSPANVRDVFARTVGWFDRYLKPHATGAADGE